MKNFAIQIAGGCPFKCDWCSTGRENANPSSTSKVSRATENNLGLLDLIIENQISSTDHVHITGTGEPGVSQPFHDIASKLVSKGVKVSVCCASPKSIIPGLHRVDISCNQFTAWEPAIKKAKELNIPVIATVVNADGSYNNTQPEEIAKKYNANGALIRGLRSVGLASELKSSGLTKWWVEPSLEKELAPFFPSACFPEFEDVTGVEEIKCFDHNGQEVRYLGLPEEKVITEVNLSSLVS